MKTFKKFKKQQNFKTDNYYAVSRQIKDTFEYDNFNEIIKKLDFMRGKKVLFKELNEKNIDELIKSTEYFKEIIKKNNSFKIHSGCPLPDREEGRPYLKWNYCAYSGCNSIFKSTSKLVEHLELMDCYKRNYHTIHEQIIKSLELTEDKILEENITKCPSTMCVEVINTPYDLITHFKKLGLEPFWKKGEELNMIEVKYNYTLPNKIYETENICYICYENEPNILYCECGHQVICSVCHLKFNKKNRNFKTCVICRKRNNIILPYKRQEYEI